ncbi:hypothetical protein GCM10027592_56260 [Spirosoma flavus]
MNALDYVVIKFAQNYDAGSQTFEAGGVYQLPAVVMSLPRSSAALVREVGAIIPFFD